MTKKNKDACTCLLIPILLLQFSPLLPQIWHFFCPILEDCAIFWREETSNFSGDDYDDTQIEDDVFIVFLWSNLNFRIVPDAWLGLCVNCVFSYIREVF